MVHSDRDLTSHFVKQFVSGYPGQAIL